MIDKTVLVLEAIAGAPCALGDLVAATGLPRPTAHRLALALEHHGLVGRDAVGRFVIGPRIVQWASPQALRAVDEAVRRLRDASGESAQVYRRSGDVRICLAAAEPASGLRDTVPVGARLSMKAGSAAQVLTAWLPPDERAAAVQGAAFDERLLADVRRRGWAHSVAEREPGVASLAAPVFGPGHTVVAAASISGPIERLAKPTAVQRRALLQVAQELSVDLE